MDKENFQRPEITVSERIEQVVEAMSMSKNKFAGKIGISSSLLSKIISRKANFGIDVMTKLINTFPSINATWMLTGVGEMFNSEMSGIEENTGQKDKNHGVPHRYVKMLKSGGKSEREKLEESLTERERRMEENAPELEDDTVEDGYDLTSEEGHEFNRVREQRWEQKKHFYKRLVHELNKKHPDLWEFISDTIWLERFLNMLGTIEDTYFERLLKDEEEINVMTFKEFIRIKPLDYKEYRDKHLTHLREAQRMQEGLSKLVEELHQALSNFLSYDTEGAIDKEELFDFNDEGKGAK